MFESLKATLWKEMQTEAIKVCRYGTRTSYLHTYFYKLYKTVISDFSIIYFWPGFF